MPGGASFSACGAYRYVLWRTWGDGAPLNVIGLNPSTADATRDDPTIRRCTDFARRWGLGGVVVTNLFGLRSTQPRGLYEHREPVGGENDAAILAQAQAAGMVLAAWGTHGALHGRGAAVAALLRERSVPLLAFSPTRDGHPRHPLYVPKVAEPRPYLGL